MSIATLELTTEPPQNWNFGMSQEPGIGEHNDKEVRRDVAARKLLEKYSGRLRNMVKIRLNDRLRSRIGESDIVQSALKSLFNKDCDFSDPDGLWPLLVGIAINKTRAAHARHAKLKRNFLVEVHLAPSTLHDLPEIPLPEQADELIDLLYGLISDLPEQQREIAKMRFEGYSYNEIATRLKTTNAAARKAYERAIDNLKQMAAKVLVD